MISLNFTLEIEGVYIQGYEQGEPFPKAYKSMSEEPEDVVNKLHKVIIKQLDETLIIRN